jgi:hypothetical protein
MFRPARSNTNGFDASGSGDLTLPPPTTLTEAFIAAHIEVLCQILQAQQRMAQQLQQMPPMQQKHQPSKPCSPEVPTQSDINAIVGATQLLEGQNSMLNQMVYDIVQGCYGEPSQTSLADSLSQSLSASMVEQARLFNLLEGYVNQDRPCRMDLPGPTTSVGTRTNYSVGLWGYPACATRHLMAWSTRTTEEKYSVRKLYMSRTVWKTPRRTRLVLSPYSDL